MAIETMNDLFLQALRGENRAKRPPIWLMRQAGKYMASYQKLRSKHSFLGMCKNPELIAEVTHLPIQEFGFDAAIVFSDILLITEAMGLNLHFEEGKGPILSPCITPQDVKKLDTQNIADKLAFVFDGIRLLKTSLNVPLIGFAGAPFTVASYMIEGQSSRDLKKTKEWMLKDPHSFHELLEKITQATVTYLNAQIDAGCDAIQLFDSWAHVLAWRQFEEFSARYLDKILTSIKSCPTLVFARGSSIFYERLASLPLNGISLDWQSDLQSVRKKVPQKLALQGNLDPDILLSNVKTVEREARGILEKMRHDPAFIFNLGHGILPTTSEDVVRALVSCVRNFE